MTARQTPDVARGAKPQQLVLPWCPQDHQIFAHAAEAAQQGEPSPRVDESEARARQRRSLPTYPTVFVQVPRAVADRYWSRPWAEVLDAARFHRDGLERVDTRPLPWRGLAGEGPPRIPDVAFLAEGQDNWRGRTVLFQQNW